ncbi:hypothetical protein GW17_00007278 [Ensete ventricosum]|nr:hypothetical protein GW17_00007278 [Ensete ventricosum]
MIFALSCCLNSRNEALRVAFIHEEENALADGTISKEFYSKLVKADASGKDQVVGIRTARYREVPPKIDHRRPIEGEIDRRRSIEGEKGKKKKRKRKKKEKKRGEEIIPSARTPSPLVRCCCPWVASVRAPSLPAGRRCVFSRPSPGRKIEATMNPVQTDVLTPVRVNTIQTEKGRAEGRRQRGGAVEEEACQRVAGLMRSKW